MLRVRAVYHFSTQNSWTHGRVTISDPWPAGMSSRHCDLVERKDIVWVTILEVQEGEAVVVTTAGDLARVPVGALKLFEYVL
jgi:hypothetical protein